MAGLAAGFARAALPGTLLLVPCEMLLATASSLIYEGWVDVGLSDPRNVLLTPSAPSDQALLASTSACSPLGEDRRDLPLPTAQVAWKLRICRASAGDRAIGGRARPHLSQVFASEFAHLADGSEDDSAEALPVEILLDCTARPR